jgi:hypothetical protein
MLRRLAIGVLFSLALLVPAVGGEPSAGGPVVTFAQAGTGDPAVLARMEQANRQLRTARRNFAVEQIEFFTLGGGRPDNRVHQVPLRWVPNDRRRDPYGLNPVGTHLSYLVDQSDGATRTGLTNAQTEAAIDRALVTWQRERCLRDVRLVKRSDLGFDPDILDGLLGFGTLGFPGLADIVNAGWLPGEFFDALGGPGSKEGILAFSVSFVFLDDQGRPTDINGDNYLDTAFNEVYYNDYFGTPSGTRASYPWGVNIPLPGIDVETVALHENGHSLGLGHFGPPPAAIMNPVYAGPQLAPLATDHAGMCATFGSWPNR